MDSRVGFIGLGLMGAPMVRNLASAGYSLVVHNRSSATVDRICAELPSVRGAESPGEVARESDVVITMLPSSADVEEVALGEHGLISEMSAGDLMIDMSTIAPSTAVNINTALHAIGASALDAPVSGGDKGAADGTLSIMVGGSERDFERARPIFDVLGSTVVHCGGPGSGQMVKACNQIVVAIAYQALSEALVLGAKAGVDPARICTVLGGGLAASGVLKLRGDRMIEGDFEPGGRVELHLKDLDIALATGRELGVPLPVTAVVAERYRSLAANGLSGLDHSALLRLVEEDAGLRLSELRTRENGDAHRG